MKNAKKTSGPTAIPLEKDFSTSFLWLLLFVGSLFFLPNCLDRYLAPRFFFVSGVLLMGIILFWKKIQASPTHTNLFDWLFVTYYGWNIASLNWAFSFSEGIFYTQKILIGLASYGLLRWLLAQNTEKTLRTICRIAFWLGWVVIAIIAAQFFIALQKYKSLNNDDLYEYVVGAFGNKGLLSDFLFLIVVFNVMGIGRTEKKPADFLGISRRAIFTLLGATAFFILLVQTRTVYLALALGTALYVCLRALAEPEFRPVFFKKMLPISGLAVGALFALASLKGSGNTLAERINPMTYLESASANERRFVWYKTDLLNAEHFWKGVGNGSWKLWFPSKGISGGYRMEEKNIIFTRAHNDYLEIRAELGMIGVSLFIGLFVLAFAAGFFVVKQHPDPLARHDAMAILAGLLGFCIIQYFDFPRERIEMQVIQGILFAIVVHYAAAIFNKMPNFSLQKTMPLVLALTALGLALNLVIGGYRMVGEIHNVKLLKAQAKNDNQGMIREAEASENAFYEYNDVVLPLQWSKGIGHFQLGQTPEALAAFEKAYQLNPWSFQVLNNYASALVKNNQFTDAIPLFEKTVEINPKYDEGKFNLAYSWYNLGDTTKALQWVQRVDTIPNPKTPDEVKKNAELKRKQAVFVERIKGGAPQNPR